MPGRELANVLKEANWSTAEQVRAFIDSVDQVDGISVKRMLDVLGKKKLQTNSDKHKLRCMAFGGLAARVEEKHLFGTYVQALKGADSVTRSTLESLLPGVNDVKAHARLCALLKSEDAALRQTASRVLQKLGGKTVLQTLTELVSTPGFRGRGEAVDVATAVAGHYAVPLLRDVLLQGNSVEKGKALKFLSDPHYVERDREGALAAIEAGFQDPVDSVANKAIEAYSALCTVEQYYERVAPFLDDPSLSRVKTAVQALRHFDSPRVFTTLRRVFRAGPNVIRHGVLSTLEVNGNNDGLPLLVEVLSHPSAKIRAVAAEVFSTLTRLGRFDVERTVLHLLKSPDKNVRRIAADVMSSTDQKLDHLVPRLLRFLRDEDWWVRERVADGLIAMAGKALVEPVKLYLSDPSDVIRRFAVDVLARIADPATQVDLMNTAHTDSDWLVRERAIEVLGQLVGQDAVPFLVHTMQRDPQMRVICLTVLTELRAQSSLEHGAAMLEADDPDVRLAALRYLAGAEGWQQVAAVAARLDDPDDTIRREARELLERWNKLTPEMIDRASDVSGSLLDDLLTAVGRVDGTDLLIAPGRKVYIKRLGELLPLGDDPLTLEDVRALLLPRLTRHQRQMLAEMKEVDLSHEVKARQLRFRGNIFEANCGLSAVFRIVKGQMPALEDLGLPTIVGSFADIVDGLVLVGGPTGCGKTTTLTALIDRINTTSSRHVITLEDPIELLHETRRSMVTQREVGSHTRSFPTALRSALRQDPDVILVGEMRDLETIAFAVSAAETGHLVFGTVHTASAHLSVDRIINAYPPGQQDYVRSTLSQKLRAVVCQHLLRRKDGNGMCLAAEVMINNDAIANLIRQSKTFQIPSVMATSAGQSMQLMDRALMRLCEQGEVDPWEAFLKASEKKDFEELVFEDYARTKAAVSVPRESEVGGGPG